jgi:hypothetical protein
LLEEPPITAAVRYPGRFLVRLMETRAAQAIRDAKLDYLELSEPTRELCVNAAAAKWLAPTGAGR